MEKKDIKKEIVQCSLAYILLSGSGGLVDKVNLEGVESPVLRNTIVKVQSYFSAEGEYRLPTISIHEKCCYDKCYCPNPPDPCVYERGDFKEKSTGG